MIKLCTITIAYLLSLSLLSSAASTDSYEDSTEATTTTSGSGGGGSVLIRRRIGSARMPPSGGGRLSLLNSRFSRRPRKKNLDPEQLMEILGNYFDPDFMSVEEPAALADKDPERGASYVVKRDTWQYAELVKQLQNSNLSVELAQVAGSRLLLDPVIVKTVETWLLNRASCPVRYAWEDIGNLFWPRYIKRGECASVPGTCSWPPGMHCVPSGTSTLHVLRWQCKVPRGKGGARRKTFKSPKDPKGRDWPKKINEGEQPANLKCSWVRVPYPITSDCLCTC